MSIIKVQNLCKEFQRPIRKEGLLGSFKSLISRNYETKKAVSNITFEIAQGEIVGYLGPNGAGKSTTIKMLAGILVPTLGEIEVNGLVPYKNRKNHASKIGVVFGQRTQLWWDIPVVESLNLMRYMYNLTEKEYRERMNNFVDYLGLNDFLNTPVRQLSLGQRMRADLCAALIHNPPILFLDEPTIGLDVVVKENIRKFIKMINEVYHTTVILTTHDMSDIEKLCSRVIVIDQGKMMYDGQLDHLRKTYGADELMIVETETKVTNMNTLSYIGVTNIRQEENKLFLSYDKTKVNSATIINRLMENNRVLEFSLEATEIDEVIRRMYISSSSLQGGERIVD